MKKGVRRNLTKFTESTCARVPFLSLRPATLLKKRLRRRCFPANFVKFLRTSFLQNTSGQLLLNTYSTCGAGLQSGTSPQFHFLRFFLFGTPESVFYSFLFSLSFFDRNVSSKNLLFVSICCFKKSDALYFFLQAVYF